MLRRHARPCALSAAAAAPAVPAYGQVRCQRRSGPGRAGGGWEAVGGRATPPPFPGLAFVARCGRALCRAAGVTPLAGRRLCG